MDDIIPTHADSYDTLNFVHTHCVSVYKKIGYTPLQVLEAIRPFLKPDEAMKATYVGRLDPMAEGWIYILWSGDMDEKKKLASLDKMYEVDVVFGIETDTCDVLGLVTKKDNVKVLDDDISDAVSTFVGPFTYAYPSYSSPHIKKTLKGETQDMRMQNGRIDKIDIVHVKNVSSSRLYAEIQRKLSLCRMGGDFRLESIQKEWKEFFSSNDKTCTHVTLRVYCGSGTYMRTLALELGKKLGTSGFAMGIRRIGVGGVK